MTESSDGSSPATMVVNGEDDEPDQRLTFDVVTESGDWRLFEPVTEHLERISKAILRQLELPDPDCQVCIALCSNDAVRRLNLQYRGKDSTTNVLSFPSSSTPAAHPDHRFLGDLAIADAVLRSEAEESATPLAHHFAHIVIHGVLHLLGFDHSQQSEAEEMEQLEVLILADLGIADPYANAELLHA